MKPYIQIDNTPFFESILKYKGKQNYNLSYTKFFRNCTRFIINTDEFHSWLGDETTYEKQNHELDFSIPFNQFWFEFFIDHKRSSMRDTLTGNLLFGAGFDLENRLYFALIGKSEDRNVGLISFSIDKPYKVFSDTEKSIEAFAHATIRSIGAYLQTEFVDAYQKSFRSGYKIKRGKLIKLESKYTVIYRKQPIKKTYQSFESSSEIEWNHRWRVRGHWRRIEGIGKDPEGNKVQGFTWIKECIKGPENKPLLNKPRIVKDQLPKQFMPMKALG